MNVAYGNVIKGVKSIGNLKVCEVDVTSDTVEECILENEFGKLLLFVCNVNEKGGFKNVIVPSNCATKTFVNQMNPNEKSPESDTYDIFQNFYGINNLTLSTSFAFYGTPYSNKDIDFTCLCYGENKSNVKHIMKISFKKMTKKIKGCDFGDNIPSRRDLTNNIALNENSNCFIHAYPGDVVGINCFKKDNGNHYNDNLELIPHNCFHNVYYGYDLILSSKNLIPNSRVIPDSSEDVKLTTMHSYMSYIVLPIDVDENIKFSCSCRRDQYVGTMHVYTKLVNNILYDTDKGTQITEEWDDNIPMDEEWDVDKQENEKRDTIDKIREKIKSIEDHYGDNKNSENYRGGINGKNERYSEDRVGQRRKGNRNDGGYIDDAHNRDYIDDINDEHENSDYYAYKEGNRGSSSYSSSAHFSDNYYDMYNVGDALDGNSTRRRNRTFWQNLFGLSSSPLASFHCLIIAFLSLFHGSAVGCPFNEASTG
ncbi:6-cysteine protein (P36p) [Plasmodium ovale curtisi]|uniref:6-cysteine protein (P36p) n=1 Tax=Plasmodium ovale curtisi TaxID=864141 RepID=A0A1A8VIB0_PLAOA|nr:6-cysteine protein (P36p) [Plasmodium ovale curtisi]SBT02899.1 6-cysteine protein (P36p) [Plasmodium ovale curtisi]